MRLVTFENRARQRRTGAVTGNGRIVDLNAAYALYLRDIEGNGAYQRIADALVPTNMRELFEGGDKSLDAARLALEYALSNLAKQATGPAGEQLIYAKDEVKLRAPIIPK